MFASIHVCAMMWLGALLFNQYINNMYCGKIRVNMKRKLLSYFFLQENGATMNTLFGTKKIL